MFQNHELRLNLLVMKKAMFLFLSLMILVSCNSDDDAGDVITHKFEQINTILPQGKWYVSQLFMNNAEHTHEFTSFEFTFKQDGSVEGKTDLYTEMGTWSYLSTPNKGEQLKLQFNGTPPFDKISSVWDIVTLNLSKVELSDSSTHPTTTLLTFKKL